MNCRKKSRRCSRVLVGGPCPRAGFTTREGQWFCRPCVAEHDHEAKVREIQLRGAPETERERTLKAALLRYEAHLFDGDDRSLTPALFDAIERYLNEQLALYDATAGLIESRSPQALAAVGRAQLRVEAAWATVRRAVERGRRPRRKRRAA